MGAKKNELMGEGEYVLVGIVVTSGSYLFRFHGGKKHLWLIPLSVKVRMEYNGEPAGPIRLSGLLHVVVKVVIAQNTSSFVPSSLLIMWV